MAEKTSKTYKKRFKVTKKGKVVQKRPGMGHYNAKEARSKQLKKKRTKSFDIKKKTLKGYLPH